ncbi:replication initiator protein A [Staphylococcus equorum]|uniref:Replication initiator A N-terminal domain-containing protein n=1 Tax=Staphylococcus equorum TaxID=246432 RepID=A0AAP7LV27_9STAP|nr:replication initiator protein A [Staphylococcus equorum]OEK58925.1 hypothetical protein ASS94_00960 [Staphylococcus equorum]
MSKENKFTENSVENQKFYKLPRFLYKEMDYVPLNHSVKILYAILCDDYTLMRNYQANNPNTKYFLDKDNNTYIAPKREYLADLLNCSVDTITRMKNQLVKHGLLKQERAGGNKPNRLYPLVPKNVKARGFFMLPKTLFTEPFYKSMANISKVAFGFLDSRFALSSMNDYKDRNGNVCCKYSYNSLANDLKCSRNTIKEIKNELLALGLIFQVKDEYSQSLNFYVRQPHMKQETKDKKDEVEQKGKVVGMSEKRKDETMDGANGNQLDGANGNPNYTTASQTTLSNTCTNDKSDKNIESTYKETARKHFKLNHNNTESDYSLCKAEKERYFSKYPKDIGMALNPYDLEDAQSYMKIICKAKNMVNEEQGTNYTLEDMDIEIARRIDAVRRAMKKKKETPKAMLGYFKVAMLDCIYDYNNEIVLNMLRNDGYDEQQLETNRVNLEERKRSAMSMLKWKAFNEKITKNMSA